MDDNIDFKQIGELWFDTSAEALVLVDDAGEIRSANLRAEELFGYSKATLQSMRVEELIPSRYHKNHHQHRENYAKNPGKRRMGIGMDLVALSKSGSEIPVEISMNRITLGDASYTLALVSDISLRKSMEAELHKVNATLERKVEERTAELRKSQKLHEVIARHFPNGTINVLNQELEYIFAEGKELFRMGVTSERLIGTSYVERIPAELRKEARQFLLSVMSGEPQSFELYWKDQYYQLDAVPLQSEQGVADRILVVEHNITEQKRAEQKMISALQRERELGELKSRFVSMASHEFRTPLASVLSSVGILKKYLDKESGAEFEAKRSQHLDRIRNSVHTLNGILQDFLSLDKLESGHASTAIQEVDLRELFEVVADEVSHQLMSPDQLKLHLPEAGSTFSSDPRVITNVTLNLLSNAIKYSPKGSAIHLDVTAGDELVIACRDEGIGIPLAEQRYLFDRFFRANNAANIQGTGLGLNIVKRYLDLLKGSISFQSQEGQGTVFYVRIPSAAS